MCTDNVVHTYGCLLLGSTHTYLCVERTCICSMVWKNMFYNSLYHSHCPLDLLLLLTVLLVCIKHTQIRTFEAVFLSIRLALSRARLDRTSTSNETNNNKFETIPNQLNGPSDQSLNVSTMKRIKIVSVFLFCSHFFCCSLIET